MRAGIGVFGARSGTIIGGVSKGDFPLAEIVGAESVTLINNKTISNSNSYIIEDCESFVARNNVHSPLIHAQRLPSDLFKLSIIHLLVTKAIYE